MADPVLIEAAPAARALRIKVNAPLFVTSAALILAFVLFGALFPEQAERLFTTVQATIIIGFGWFYILAVAGFLVFVLFLMISRYGNIRLGPDDCEAEYSYISWFAMLFRLLVPVLFTFLWMTVFGNTAIALDLSGVAPIAQIVANDLPVALFETLAKLPFSGIASGIATLLIITFFVTSADSGALVIDMITNGAADDPPVWQRIFWALCAGLVAAVLLVAGGLQALQTAAIASALPLAVIMVFMCYGLLRALQTESLSAPVDLSIAASALPDEPAGLTWRQRLASITQSHDRTEVTDFLATTVSGALTEMAQQMRDNGLVPTLEHDEEHLVLEVPHDGHGTFRYTVRARAYRAASFAYVESRKSEGAKRQHYRAMAHTSEGDQPHDLTGLTRDQIINDLLNRYARFRHTRRLA
ncbi:hypothetical protein GRI62_09695 [Erythrobacter arachoides]|uniref:Choline transporter n=1 Tax=Aurantiacibacter arachoides TaxID=1850444 RepID=A0A845A2Q3_9SPHN|nr:BCCT family transporter [Aurantiacibacter arachoides]MXO93880.1 hypothetical protein [Aurantiacibacter arachoides]GGD45999.1 hypothetical protein GCM10011411_02000 [Aurantiacibacter arachoides]